VALLHAYGASMSLPSLSKFGQRSAKHAPQRAAFIAGIGERGAAILTTAAVSEALLAAAGQARGGLLCEHDLRVARPGDEAVAFEPIDDRLSAATTAALGDGTSGRRAEVVVAADPRGQVCAVSYVPASDGLSVDSLGISLPRDGEPVHRGTSRVTPGTARPAAFPIALLSRSGDGWFGAIGVQAGSAWPASAIAAALHPALADTLRALRGDNPGSAAIAATVARRKTDSLSV
jgi:hypothetical protein